MTNPRTHYRAVALCALLAGCSGGGGGTPAATAAAPAPAPAVAPPAAGTGGPINLQDPNSTVSYQAATLYGSLVNATSGKTTVTLTTDASGKLKAVSFDLPGFSLTDSGPTVSPTSSSTVAIGNVAIILRETIGSPSTKGYTLSQVAGTQILSSSAFGLWGLGDQAGGALGGFAFGNLTPATAIPVTGSASFNGTVTGMGLANNGNTIYALQGDTQINANFSNQSVTTKLTNLNTMNVSTSALGSLPDLTGNSAISGNAYSGAISGGGLTGTMTGNFYGPAAQETAGIWQAAGGGSFWSGSYGAKK